MQRVDACFLCFSGLEQMRILLGWHQYQVDRWSVLAWVDLATNVLWQTWAVSNLITFWIIPALLISLSLQTFADSAYVGWLGCICGFICSAAPCMPMI